MIMRLFLFVLAIPLALSGCGGGPDLGKPVNVTGKATLDGQPLADATVVFHATESKLPADKRTATGKTDATGAFTLSNVYPAQYQVSFDKGEAPDATKAAVPAANPLTKYALGVSELKADVAGDKKTFEFALVGAGNK